MKYIPNITKLILIFLILNLSFNEGLSNLSEPEYEGMVKYFVECINNTDIDKLDSIISYPIQRPYPIPPIRNKQELKKRYSEIFDDTLTSVITSSNIKADWSDLDWRGIMLLDGIVWLDDEGRFIGTNYTSAKERDIEIKWIEYERNLFHSDLKKFKKPIHTIETDKFIIRIDLLANQKYRYASWTKESKISNKPDLMITNGECLPDGGGGNKHFTFTNGQYRYIVYVNTLGIIETKSFNLEVIKGDKVILNQPAVLKELK